MVAGPAGVVRALVQASHPGPTVVVTALSAGLLAGAGAPAGTVVLAASAVLAGQLSVGWSNDWIDAARDRAVGRTDKPVVTGAVDADRLRTAAVAAAAACVALSLATGLRPGAVHVLAVALAWAYNAGLKATAFSWVPYAASFGLLPLFLVMTLPGNPLAPVWAVLCGSLLGAGAHLANALPDLEDDHATGVRGLPHRLGRVRASVLAPVLLLGAVLAVVLGPEGGVPGWTAVVGTVAVLLAVTAGTVAVTAPRSRMPFGLSMAVAALCVVLLVAAGGSFAQVTAGA